MNVASAQLGYLDGAAIALAIPIDMSTNKNTATTNWFLFRAGRDIEKLGGEHDRGIGLPVPKRESALQRIDPKAMWTTEPPSHIGRNDMNTFRLHIEKHKYASIPAYAENFARQRAHVDDTVLDVGTSTVEQRLDDYRSAVDEVVLRAITPADSLDDYLRFIDDARALV